MKQLEELLIRAYETETDPKYWLIQLDYRTWRQLVQSRAFSFVDQTWHGVKVDRPKLAPLDEAPRLDDPIDMDATVVEPQLISIEITLRSGRKCYIDDPDNHPIWTEGAPK